MSKIQEGGQRDDRVSGDYMLPVCDTNKDRRNFPGTKKTQYASLADMQDLLKTTDTTEDN